MTKSYGWQENSFEIYRSLQTPDPLSSHRPGMQNSDPGFRSGFLIDQGRENAQGKDQIEIS